MAKKKKRPKTGGRQKLPEDKKRVPFASRVLPETKVNIETQAAAEKLSIGRLLDKIFNPKK